MIYLDALPADDRLDEEAFAALSEPDKELYLDSLPYFDPESDSENYS
jgi:hypothetical protein